MSKDQQNLEYCEGALSLKKTLEESYLKLGEYLYNIKEKELYDPQWGSWEVFCMELKMAQNTISRFIQIYTTFILEYKLPPADVVSAGGWTVISELLPVIENKQQAIEWLEKAKDLTREDLRAEVKEAQTGVPQASCKHKNTYTVVICRDCGIRMEEHKDHD